MALLRIGDKLIDKDRILAAIDRILDLRSTGLSQQEVANRLRIDRTFVSRLESLGEIRKGGSIALVGFPIDNKEEVLAVARQEGVDYTFLLTERERWELLEKPGLELFNELMVLMAKVREFSVVIILGHNEPARFIEALLGREVTALKVAQVPGSNGRFDPDTVRRAIRSVKQDE